MKTLTVGIMSQEKIRARMLAVARGEYTARPGEPRIWFTSMRSLAEVLSDDNRALLHTIECSAPSSISALARATGRTPGNLSRTLHTLSRYGIVELKHEHQTVRPIAKATRFRIIA